MEALVKDWDTYLGGEPKTDMRAYLEALKNFMIDHGLSAQEGFCLGALIVSSLHDYKAMTAVLNNHISNRVN